MSYGRAKFCLVVVSTSAALVLSSVSSQSALRRHPRHAHVSRHVAIRAHGAARSQPRALHGHDASPTPTCRYADGTPYDPDIIGGANHVGDGGPAVNLGGFDPCGR